MGRVRRASGEVSGGGARGVFAAERAESKDPEREPLFAEGAVREAQLVLAKVLQGARSVASCEVVARGGDELDLAAQRGRG